jgi:hypothetical protein
VNERIRELVRQAGLDDADFPIENWDNVPLAKFAELIVQECADLFVDQKYMILNPHEPFANERVRALKEHDKYTVKKIKEHFGEKL